MVENEEDEFENETICANDSEPNSVAIQFFSPDQEVKIEYDDDRQSRDDKKSGYSPSISQPKIDTAESKKEIDRKLIVKGSVLFGYGLEPLPVGRFVLTETNSIDDDLEDELAAMERQLMEA